MIDAKGVLNPGLMPQRLDDLNLLAPPRDDVDDVLVERWNRVTEVWRTEVEFRNSSALRHDEGLPRPGQRSLVARGCLPLDRTCAMASPDSLPNRGGVELLTRTIAGSRRGCRVRPGASSLDAGSLVC